MRPSMGPLITSLGKLLCLGACGLNRKDCLWHTKNESAILAVLEVVGLQRLALKVV